MSTQSNHTSAQWTIDAIERPRQIFPDGPFGVGPDWWFLPVGKLRKTENAKDRIDGLVIRHMLSP